MAVRINWLVILLSITAAENFNVTTDYSPKNINFNCTTHECNAVNLEFEKDLRNSMDSNVDPCDNFFKFACGNFNSVNYHSRASGLILSYRERILVNSIELKKPLYHFEFFHFFTNHKESCETLNNENTASTPYVEKKRMDYLKEVLSKFGGWPVVEGSNWNDTHFDWTEFGIKADNSGINVFPFLMPLLVIEYNYKILHIKTPKLEFSVDDLSSNKSASQIQAYQNHMVEVAKFLGATKHQVKQLNKSLEFELKLINISKNENISLNNSNYDHVMTIKEITAKWPSVNWTKFFSSRPQSKFYSTNESRIFIENLKYVTSLEKLIQETPKRVLADFAIWKTIQHLIRYVGSATLFNIQKNYYKSINSSVKMEPINCYYQLTIDIPELLLSYYLHYYPISEENISFIDQIIFDIKKELIETVNRSNIFDVKAIDHIIKTLHSLKTLVYQTDKVTNDKQLKEYVRGLEITNDNFLKNYLNVTAFKSSKIQENLVKPRNLIDPTSLISRYTLLYKTAFYLYDFNFIIVSPHALANLWMSKYLPSYVNYGSIGFIIAHELGHSIDHINRAKNIYNIQENGWSAMSNQKYKETQECLIEQFDNYTFEDINQKINGTQYIQENISDLMGIKIAYLANQNLVRKHGLESTYSSLPYNSNQLFWMSYANIWCPRSKSYKKFLKNVHAPTDKRLIGTLSNMPEFAKDFNCPLGSKMNPIKKCSLF